MIVLSIWWLAAGGALALYGAYELVDDLNGDDGDVDAEGAAPEMLAEPQIENTPLGEALRFSGEETLTGTAGDDTLAADQDAELAPSQVNLGAGDDSVALDDALDITVSGEMGDDTLISRAEGGVLEGGEDQDMIFGGPAATLTGGAGEDSLSLDMTRGANAGLGQVDGGAGDDVVRVIGALDSALEDTNRAVITAGDGDDTIIARLELAADVAGEEGEVLDSGITVSDFDPDADQLTVEVIFPRETADRVISEFTIQDSTTSPGDSEVLVTFGATESDPEVTTRIALQGVTGLTDDDVTLRPVVADA